MFGRIEPDFAVLGHRPWITEFALVREDLSGRILVQRLVDLASFDATGALLALSVAVGS